MKKQLILITLIFSLFSCNNSNNSSISSTYLSDILPTTNENIIKILNDASKKKNYQLNYTVSSYSYTDIITENYLYYTNSKIGLVRMENIDKELFDKDNILFNFEVDDQNQVEITRATVESGIPYFSISQLDPLQMLNNEVILKENDFSKSTLSEDYVYSNNKQLVYIMAYLVGIQSLTINNTIFGVDFIITENGLEFKFTTYDDNDQLTYYDASGIILNIGNAKEEILDNYFSSINYKFDESLNDINVTNINKDSLYSKAVITYNNGNFSSVENVIEVNYTPNYLEINNTTNSKNYKNILYKGSNGEVVEKYLDGTNHIYENVLSNQKFDEYLTTAKDVMKPSLFKKISDKKYRYFGIYPDEFLLAFVQSSTESYQINSIDLVLDDNNKVKEINAYSTVYESDNGNQQYVISITDFQDSKNIEQITTLKPINGIKEKLQPAFDKLKYQKTSEKGLKLSMTDSMLEELNEKTELYYTKDIIMIDKKYAETTSNPNNDDHEYSGFYQTQDGLASFYINKTNNTIVSTADLDSSDTIVKHWFDLIFNFSTDAFELDDTDKTNKTFKLRDEITYVKKQFAFLWGKNNNNIDPSTIRLILNEQGYLSQIKFCFSAFANREATIDLIYGSNSQPITIPSYVIDKLKNVKSWTLIDSWKKDNNTIYQQFIEIFGEEFANNFPYYFTEDTSTNWRSLQLNNVTLKIYNIFNDIYYFQSFGRLLETNGYIKDGKTYINEKYHVKVVLGDNTQEGMIVEKI